MLLIKFSFPSNDFYYGSFSANFAAFITIFSNFYVRDILGPGCNVIMCLGLNVMQQESIPVSPEYS
jgi:hypothetical protein